MLKKKITSRFGEFCEEIKREYGCREKIEFTSCSWEKRKRRSGVLFG